MVDEAYHNVDVKTNGSSEADLGIPFAPSRLLDRYDDHVARLSAGVLGGAAVSALATPASNAMGYAGQTPRASFTRERKTHPTCFFVFCQRTWTSSNFLARSASRSCLPRRSPVDGGVDGGDLAGLVDVERPAVRRCPLAFSTPYASRLPWSDRPASGSRLPSSRRPSAAAARQRHAGRLGELGVVLDGVGARHEVGDVVLLDLVAVIGQRLALDRAALRERLREPGDDHRLLAAISDSLWVLPSVPCRVKSGAMSPTLTTVGTAVCSPVRPEPDPEP